MTWEDSTGEPAKEFAGRGIVPDGTYPFFVEKVELKQSVSSGKKYVNFWLSIDHGQFAGRKIFYPIYASTDYANHPNQEWANQQVNALKRMYLVTKTKVPSRMPTPSDLQTLNSARGDMKVEIEEDQNGKPVNRVLDVFPYTPDPIDAEYQEEIYDDDVPF